MKFSTVLGATSGQNATTMSPSLVRITATCSFITGIWQRVSALSRSECVVGPAGAPLVNTTNLPPHSGPLPLEGGEGESSTASGAYGAVALSPSEGEGAGVRGP